MKRKIREALMLLESNRHFRKDEVLEMYFERVVPYGPRINGVDVAAQSLFSKTPSNLFKQNHSFS